MNTLRDIIQKAIEQIDTFRHPDLDEFRAAIEPLLQAAEIGSMSRDCIETISLTKTSLVIDTSYSVRGCVNNASYTLPLSVIDSENPIKTARIWGISKKIDDHEFKIRDAQRTINYHNEKLNELRIKLEQA